MPHRGDQQPEGGERGQDAQQVDQPVERSADAADIGRKGRDQADPARQCAKHQPGEEPRQAVGAARLAFEREVGLEAAPDQRAHRPGQRRKQDDAQRKDQRRIEPRRVGTGRSWLEHHERRAGVEAPARDAAVLDLGRKTLTGAGVAPNERLDLDPVARAGAKAVEPRKADLAILGQPDLHLSEQPEQAHEIG